MVMNSVACPQLSYAMKSYLVAVANEREYLSAAE